MTRTTDPNRPTDPTVTQTGPIGSPRPPSSARTGAALNNVIPFHGRRRSPSRPATAPQTYTPAQVAELLGISLSGVYNHLRAGTIPSRRLGARWLVPVRLFHAWLDGEETIESDGPWTEEAY